MRMFMEETAGAFEEIRDFEVQKIKNQKLQEVLLEILKLSLHSAEESFEYVAIADPFGSVEIRYVRNRKACDPFNKGEKQKIGRNFGYFMTSFCSDAIKVHEIHKYIKDGSLQTCLTMAGWAIKEAANIHFSHP